MKTGAGIRASALILAMVAAIALAPRWSDRYPATFGVVVAAQTRAAAPGFKRTPARLKRGEYLDEYVIGCFRCHSERDWKSPGAPPVQGKKGAGTAFYVGAGPVDPRKPPVAFAANITPDPETGVGRWSDEALAIAIRENILPDGRTFPKKFHLGSSYLSDEDLASVVVYLRTIPPVRNPAPELKAASPTPEKPAQARSPLSVPEPVLDNPALRGQYLAALADCASCHTADKADAPLLDKKFGGGKLMSDDPEHYLVSPNITLDPSGISYYDEAMFVRTVRTGQVTARKLYPIMPWGYIRNLTDQDLRAIFAYLKTLPHVLHTVDNTEPVTLCRRCLQRHGAGDRN